MLHVTFLSAKRVQTYFYYSIQVYKIFKRYNSLYKRHLRKTVVRLINATILIGTQPAWMECNLSVSNTKGVFSSWIFPLGEHEHHHVIHVSFAFLSRWVHFIRFVVLITSTTVFFLKTYAVYTKTCTFFFIFIYNWMEFLNLTWTKQTYFRNTVKQSCFSLLFLFLNRTLL